MTKQEMLAHDPDFLARMLGRTISDCDYYLGYGNRCKKHLWALDEAEQIDYMKSIWDCLNNVHGIATHITLEQIQAYESQML